MKSHRFLPISAIVAVLALGASGCGQQAGDSAGADQPAAVAQLQPAQGQQVAGRVEFYAVDGGVRVRAEVSNLTPGAHGFHVHEHGDLSAPDLTSAGGHFNPTNHPHAAPTSDQRHVGDLGNLEANSQGVATLDYVDTKIALDGANSIIGRAVIIHANPDDLKSQPTGNAGGRVAGGVIERAGQ